MTLGQFFCFHIASSILKVAYIFYSEKRKEGTLKMVEKKIFDTLVENEYGEYDELISEMQDLYLWLLEH